MAEKIEFFIKSNTNLAQHILNLLKSHFNSHPKFILVLCLVTTHEDHYVNVVIYLLKKQGKPLAFSRCG